MPVDPTTLGALAGFASALVVLGVPLLGFLLRVDRDVRTVLALVEGRDAVEGDGVLDRLREVETRLGRVEAAVARASVIEYEQSDVHSDAD